MGQELLTLPEHMSSPPFCFCCCFCCCCCIVVVFLLLLFFFFFVFFFLFALLITLMVSSDFSCIASMNDRWIVLYNVLYFWGELKYPKLRSWDVSYTYAQKETVSYITIYETNELFFVL